MIRILTEDKDREGIKKILNDYVPGYTIIPAMGSWKGKEEPALAIDLVDVSMSVANKIANVIKWYNEQEAVLVMDIPNTAHFV